MPELTLAEWRAMSPEAKISHMHTTRRAWQAKIDALEREMAARYLRVAKREFGEAAIANLLIASARIKA
jgi:hypothetical protein